MSVTVREIEHFSAILLLVENNNIMSTAPVTSAIRFCVGFKFQFNKIQCKTIHFILRG